MKTCNKCSISQPKENFTPDSRNKDGLQSICKPCRKIVKQAAREKAKVVGPSVLVKAKTCNKCEETKTIDLFYKDSGIADGHMTICKDCKALNVEKWRENNREQYNATQRAYMKTVPAEKRYGSEIKRRYGCTLEQYNAMLTAQGGACAICKCLHNPAEKKGRLYVDHCHDSGKVRALLCKHCNSMIGYAKDDTRVLLEAVAYLTRHKKPNP